MATTEAEDVPRDAPEDPTLPPPDFVEEDALSLISAYFKDNSPVRHQLDSFNSFIETLHRIIDEDPPINIVYNSIHTHTITFGHLHIRPPMIPEPDGMSTLLLPKLARLRSCTYAFPMYVDVTIQKVGEEAETPLAVYIGKVPIMLHSKICILHGKSREDLIRAGECTYDKGGYFIVDGVEKVIIAQERMALNRIYVHQKKQPNKYAFVGEIHSMGENQNRSPTTMYVRLHSGSSKALYCIIPFINSEVPVVILFRALGVSTDKEIVELICHDVTDLNMAELLETSLREAFEIKNQEVALDYIGKLGATHFENNEERRSYARDILQKEMLPHVGISDDCEKKKAFYLGYMIRQLLLCALGRRREDDRDHYSNKRLDLAGPLFGELFRKLFGKMRRDVKSYALKCIDHGKDMNLEVAIMAKSVTSGFNYALATGNWGLGNRVGVSQVLDRVTYLSTLSHLRRVNSSIKPDGKVVVKPRQLHTSQWGMMCPFETPTGENCGLVKNLALMAYITEELDPIYFKKLMEYVHSAWFIDLQDNSVTPSMLLRTTNIFLNGKWIGVSFADVKRIINFLNRYIHTELLLFAYVSIIGDSSLKEIRINTDSGRCTRPLFTVKNQRLKIEKQHISDSWQNLCMKGLVEYLDAEQEEYALISISIENLAKNIGYNTYTHCEIHSSLILGVSASVIPFPNHNQSPRNTYQSAMGKQAMGIYATNYQSRMDTNSSVLYYPQKPLVRTRAMKHLRFKKLPAGINAVVATSYHDGYNEGDAIIMNQSAIDRGFFRSLSTYTYRGEESLKTQFVRPSSKMEHFDEDGLPFPGTRVASHDVIIWKTSQARGYDNNVRKRIGDTGIVDQVMLTTDTTSGFRCVKVKTRMVRTPQIGDKFSSVHSQKGVIGLTTTQENMPWTVKGITPDIIINPHSIPSRVTIGHLLESLVGKRAAIEGKKKYVAPFSEASAYEISSLLSNSGYQGLEKMYDGHTGMPITSLISIGPVYYQRLNHLVDDKIQSSGRGSKESFTRAPKKGRSEYGGQRFGEMERDSVISHGGALNLRERLFYESDPYEANICQNCGIMGFMEKISFLCRICKHKAAYEVQIPYAFKLLTQELMSMGIGISLKERKGVE